MILEQIKSQPTTCGVYTFWEDEIPIYIGKAINLKARLLSHYKNSLEDAKERQIIEKADRITILETNSEFNALILEANLIKKYRPKYNIIWKDDKNYLYIKITAKDDFPKIQIVRLEDDKKSMYFGPFSSVRITRDLLRELRKIIPFCTQKKITKTACFYSKIGLCDPCPNIISIYKEKDIEKYKELKNKYRENIFKIVNILEGKSSVIVNDLQKQLKIYTKNGNYETAIITRNKLGYLSNLINLRSFKEFNIENLTIQPQLAVEEFNLFLKTYFNLPAHDTLGRFECYDISNLFGEYATASMVVFEDGRPNKSEYKRFKIKTVKQISDFWMMEEVLTRRFKNDWKHPELLIVDGGKPQVKVARKVLDKNGITIPLIGIAKNPDRIVIGTGEMKTIWFNQNSPFFNVIRYIRDESHRFAKKYHTLLRNKGNQEKMK